MNSLKAVVAGLGIYKNFLTGGMSIEQLRKFAHDSKAHITPSAYESLKKQFVVDKETGTPTSELRYPDLVELADQLGIVGKAKASRKSTAGSGSGKGSTNFDLIKAAYPTEAAVIDAMLKLERKKYEVTREDGTSDVITIQVAFKSANAPKRTEAAETPATVV